MTTVMQRQRHARPQEENAYAVFRRWLQEHFIVRRDTPHPVTFREATKHFPLRSHCASEVLATVLDELNGGAPLYTGQDGGVYHRYYLNLERISS